MYCSSVYIDQYIIYKEVCIVVLVYIDQYIIYKEVCIVVLVYII